MIGLSALVLGALIIGAVWSNVKPSPYSEFAQCLTEQGLVEYAAWWCPHCAEQEELFGSAAKHINRVECSSPGSRSFDLCPDIESTPTWELPDGSRVRGQQSLSQLSELSGCQLPE